MNRVSIRGMRSSTAGRAVGVSAAVVVATATLGVTTDAFGSVDRPTVDAMVAPVSLAEATPRNAMIAAQREARAQAELQERKERKERKERLERKAERRAEARAAAARKAAAQRAARLAAAVKPGTNRAIGRDMAAARGWGDQQFVCLDQLWTRESGWNHRASNGSSGAYGIPQAMPGSKMASAGSDWATNPRTQIAWGLTYIKSRYGSPCGAWNAFLSKGWY